MELKEAASYFIDRISFEIEEPEERLEGAIRASMGAGNPNGARVKPNAEFKEAIKKRLEDFLKEVTVEDISQEKYDEAFYKTVSSLNSDAGEKDPECKVSFGRFQKIINIWVKYHVVLAYDEDFRNEFDKYKVLLPVAHIPVDRYVLNWFREKRDDTPSIDSWIWKMSEGQYRSLQNIARDVCRNEKLRSPLELEMVKGIWS